ncbi:hypothetical protein NUW54_g8572 [Trametes sanguinea]|uniref:Uncharacterized protein n=1 Tax=Trametes sanguinea TaxID=158606 RepID=A0ACC1PCG5_9APHY|nr:hypothetical protein NUW54_g8572 [Trametes sanguinea]
MLDSERFDLAVGIIGLLSFPIVVGTIIHTQLPCTKLRELEATFAETEGLLHTSFEAGLLGPHDVASQLHTRLDMLKQDVEDARVESHCATTYAQNVKKMLTGLSRRIRSLLGEVKKLRADISTTSAHEKERLRQLRTSATCESGHGTGQQAALPAREPSLSAETGSQASSAPPGSENSISTYSVSLVPTHSEHGASEGSTGDERARS